MKVVCEHCRKKVERCAGDVNRARKAGLKLFCDRRCTGLFYRKHKTKEQLVLEKRLYDMEYRRKNRKRLKIQKREYFDRTYDPVKAAVERKARMPRHVEYCRQPAYRRWKSKYDKRYSAKKMFGPYAESFLILQKIDKEIASRMSRYDIQLANGTLNKAQTRKRDYERLIGG